MYISDPKISRVPPNRVCFRMSRPRQEYIRPTYGTLSMMTSRRDGVDAVNGEHVHWFPYLCARITCNFIIQQSVRFFTAMRKILCVCNIFLPMNLLRAKSLK